MKKIKMLKYIFIIAALSSSLVAKACINGASQELKDGTFLYQDDDSEIPKGHDFFSEDFEMGIERLDSLYRLTNSVDYLSDKGLLLILTNEYEQAIDLYLKIEQVHPNRYSTASNIGTAYELIGENEKALEWILKSIEINPESHFSSEWIHANILKAKIKGPASITSSFLLGTSFGTAEIPLSNLSSIELDELSNALYYQLNERMSFVKPKDELVAQLLFDYGNLAFLRMDEAVALASYESSRSYGYAAGLLDTRIKEAQNLYPVLGKKKSSSVLSKVLANMNIIATVGLAVSFILIFAFRKSRK